MKSKLISFIFIICIISPLYPQDKKPYSNMVSLNDNLETIILPQINSSEYSGMDTCTVCPLIYGKYREINKDLRKTLTKDKYLNGTIYRLKIHSIGAKAIEISFSDFFIPKEGSLFIYTPKYELIKGPYIYVDSKEEKIFKTVYIQGEIAILEYFVPDITLINDRSIIISSITHVFNDTFSNYGIKSGLSLSCQIDVNCPEGDPYYNIIRSGVFISNLIRDDGWVSMCSGVLLINESLDPIPYILSAAHCIDQGVEDNLDQAVFWFNYQAISCNGSAYMSDNYTITGAELRAKRAFNLGYDTDFCLLELYETLPPQYNVYYAGWNVVPFETDDLKGIHHPKGDEKKISFGYSNSIWLVYLKVKWEGGTVEGGSSGSPIFSDNNLVIGQLHGGFEHTCENLGSDYYGILGDSWWSIWGPSKRLKDWLDPDDTGIGSISGIDRNNCYESIMYLTGSFPSTEYQSEPVIIHASDRIIASQNNLGLIIQPYGNYIYKASNSIKLLSGFHTRESSHFIAKLEPCLNCDYNEMRDVELQNFNGNYEVPYFNSFKNKENKNPFIIYPNPNYGIFNIEFLEKDLSEFSLEVLNTMGNTVYYEQKIHKNKIQINLKIQPKGIYFIKVEANGKIFTKKIVYL